jgi:hypothetical protein
MGWGPNIKLNCVVAKQPGVILFCTLAKIKIEPVTI